MISRVLARLLYLLFGILYLAAGTVALLFRTGLLPTQVKDALLEVANGDLNAVHISQEFGSFLVFAGLITFWFTWHYQQSTYFQWAMTISLALFALIHLFDVRGEVRFDIGVLINAIPFFLFLFVGLLARNRRSDGKSR